MTLQAVTGIALGLIAFGSWGLWRLGQVISASAEIAHRHFEDGER